MQWGVWIFLSREEIIENSSWAPTGGEWISGESPVEYIGKVDFPSLGRKAFFYASSIWNIWLGF